jgi:hypothetical protein
MICTHKYFSGDEIENNEMGETCSTYGRFTYRKFWWGNLRERDHLEDAGVDVRIILRWIFTHWNGGRGPD